MFSELALEEYNILIGNLDNEGIAVLAEAMQEGKVATYYYTGKDCGCVVGWIGMINHQLEPDSTSTECWIFRDSLLGDRFKEFETDSTTVFEDELQEHVRFGDTPDRNPALKQLHDMLIAKLH